VSCKTLHLPGHLLSTNSQEKREKKLQYLRDYHQRNREKILQYKRDYRQQNGEKRLQYEREYYQKNREKIIQGMSEYNQRNRGRILQYMHDYNKKNRDKILHHHQKNKEKMQRARREVLSQKRKARGLPPPRKYSSWKSVTEVRNFLLQVGDLYHIQNWPEDWYRVSKDQLRLAGGMPHLILQALILCF
jgi:hypothetical protein